jgi:hypothetical protein
MVVVAHCASLAELSAAAAKSSPDIVVAGVAGCTLPDPCVELMWKRRGLSVLGIEATTGRAWLYELRLEHLRYDAIAPKDVVRSIRGAAQRQASV